MVLGSKLSQKVIVELFGLLAGHRSMEVWFLTLERVVQRKLRDEEDLKVVVNDVCGPRFRFISAAPKFELKQFGHKILNV